MSTKRSSCIHKIHIHDPIPIYTLSLIISSNSRKFVEISSATRVRSTNQKFPVNTNTETLHRCELASKDQAQEEEDNGL